MYEITEIQDVSRPRCKRYVTHIIVSSADKDDVKAAIAKATEEVRKSVGTAHVVKLYVHANEKLLCQSMWVDNEFADAPLPKPLEYNDWQDDIGIVWL